MAKKTGRLKIQLECTECKERNYVTTKQKATPRIEIKKYCPRDRKHTVHKEVK